MGYWECGVGNGQWGIQIGEKVVSVLLEWFLSNLRLRFFRDGRMCASVPIGQLNMKGKGIFLVFLFCFWITTFMQRNWQKWHCGCKQKFRPPLLVIVSFCLLKKECEWFFDKRSKTWKLGRKLNKYYHVSLQCVQKKNTLSFSATQLIFVPSDYASSC